MSKIKTGVAGIGFIGAVHVEALQRIGMVEVAAICSSSENGQAKAQQLGVAKWYASFDELVCDPDIDCIHICTPNSMHYEQVKRALQAGKHVVCEKPLTTTAAQSQELLRLANEKNRIHATNFNIRFYPLMIEIRERIARGEIGEIYSINGSYEQDWLLYETDYSWRLEPELSGSSRAVADIGSHWLDLMEFVSGKRVEAVLADFATFHKTRRKPLKPVETFSGKLMQSEDYEDVVIKTEDYANILLRFSDEARGAVTVSQVFAGKKNALKFEIAGSRKSIAWDSERPNEMWIGRRDGPNEILIKDPSLLSSAARATVSYPGGHNEGFADTFKQNYIKIYQAIAGASQEKQPLYATFEAGLRENILCEKIIESNQCGSWITVDAAVN